MIPVLRAILEREFIKHKFDVLKLQSIVEKNQSFNRKFCLERGVVTKNYFWGFLKISLKRNLPAVKNEKDFILQDTCT